MARSPAYRLQVLFEMREKKKKEAEEIYAEKKRKVAEEQKKLDEMRQKLKEMVAMRQTKKADYAERTRMGEFTVSQIQGNDRHIERLRQTEAAYQVDIDLHRAGGLFIAHATLFSLVGGASCQMRDAASSASR